MNLSELYYFLLVTLFTFLFFGKLAVTAEVLSRLIVSGKGDMAKVPGLRCLSTIASK